jgi:predicted Zn-dependent protease
LEISRDSLSPAALQVELRFLEAVVRRMPDDTETLKALAELYTRTGRYAEGLQIDRRLTRLAPLDPLTWYNLACSLALTGARDPSVEALSKAVELGYNDYDWMKQDEDLHVLHGDPRFESLLHWIYADGEEAEEGPGLPF